MAWQGHGRMLGVAAFDIDPAGAANCLVQMPAGQQLIHALIEQRTSILAVVYDPVRDLLFTAERGRGAQRNGQPIRVSAVPNLANALVATGFPYSVATSAANNAAEFARVQAQAQGVRNIGSAVLELAAVAAGRLDAYWAVGLQPWDTAASALLIAEAGGRVSEWSGDPWNPW